MHNIEIVEKDGSCCDICNIDVINFVFLILIFIMQIKIFFDLFLLNKLIVEMGI